MSRLNGNRKRGRKKKRGSESAVRDIFVRAAVIAAAVMLIVGVGTAVCLGIGNRGQEDPGQLSQNGTPTQAPQTGDGEDSQGEEEKRTPMPTVLPTAVPTALPETVEQDPDKLYAWGLQYFDSESPEHSFERAFTCFLRAAGKDHVPSMVYLGYLYYHALGTEVDHVKAAEWYTKAAGAGDVYSMNELGYMYMTGRGFARDDAKAREWYEKAAGYGSAAGAFNLSYLYENGIGVTKDTARASEWNQKALGWCQSEAEQGSAAAARILGDLYKNGIGVEKSSSRASEWYQKSRDGGVFLQADVAKVTKRVVDWGTGAYGDDKKPEGMDSIEEMAKYNAYYCTETGNDEKVIYVTFDCGYENGYTEPILDVLKAHNVSATFFLAGNYLNTSADIVKRMVDEGHTVGNHTYYCRDMATKLADVASFREEMEAVSNQFKEITGIDLWPYYRPPYEKYCIDNLQMAQDMGYYSFFWSTAYADWDPDKPPSRETAFRILGERIHPGAILLLHSVCKTNVEIMDELLTKWENEGYRFGKLEEFMQ